METMVMLLFWDLGDTWASAPLLEGVASAAPTPAVSDVKWTTAPGSTNGIREETSRALALRGVHVAMAVRNADAGKNLKEKILEKIPAAKIDVMELGISLLVSVKKFASEFKSSGIMATPFQLSKDNIELQFAINHLGHFHLTDLLLDTMKKTAQESNREGRTAMITYDHCPFSFCCFLLYRCIYTIAHGVLNPIRRMPNFIRKMKLRSIGTKFRTIEKKYVFFNIY